MGKIILFGDLPEPPSMNAMLALAKARGQFSTSVPVVYNSAQKKYYNKCDMALARQNVGLPSRPFEMWKLNRADFRLHLLRDWTELAAGLKWPIDYLISRGFITDDSPREMLKPEVWPDQVIDRSNRGLTLEIEEA